MRHRNKVKKMGRTASHRRATLRNLATALFANKQIRTTFAKAKAAQSYVERLITQGKANTVHARRQVFKLVQDRTLVKTLFDEIAPGFADRKGGYTRVVKLGMRRGDGAQMAVLQLVGFEPFPVSEEEKPKKAKRKKKAAPEEAAVAAPAAETADSETKAAKSPKKTRAKLEATEPAEEKTETAEAVTAEAETVKEAPAEESAAEEAAPEKQEEKKPKAKSRKKKTDE